MSAVHDDLKRFFNGILYTTTQQTVRGVQTKSGQCMLVLDIRDGLPEDIHQQLFDGNPINPDDPNQEKNLSLFTFDCYLKDFWFESGIDFIHQFVRIMEMIDFNDPKLGIEDQEASQLLENLLQDVAQFETFTEKGGDKEKTTIRTKSYSYSAEIVSARYEEKPSYSILFYRDKNSSDLIGTIRVYRKQRFLYLFEHLLPKMQKTELSDA